MQATDPNPALIELAGEVQAAQLPSPAERRRIRRDSGLPLRRCAVAIDVDPMTLLRWERGQSEPRHENAIKYRQLLDTLRSVVGG